MGALLKVPAQKCTKYNLGKFYHFRLKVAINDAVEWILILLLTD